MKGTLPMKASSKQATQQQAQATHSATPRLVTSRYQTLNANGGEAAGPFAAIRTSVTAPRFPLKYKLAGASLALIPPSKLLNLYRREAITWNGYVRGYRHHLDIMGAELIERELTALSESHQGKPLALLCFCNVKEGENCHRRVFADWWEEKTGWVTPEI